MPVSYLGWNLGTLEPKNPIDALACARGATNRKIASKVPRFHFLESACENEGKSDFKPVELPRINHRSDRSDHPMEPEN